MKSLKRILSLILLTLLISTSQIYADPPSWAPAKGYKKSIKHIYFPQYNMYYDLKKGTYIYMSGDTWQINAKLPSTFLKINFQLAKKIQLNIDTNTPQDFNKTHKEKYKIKSKFNVKNLKGKQSIKINNNSIKIKPNRGKK